MEKRGRLGIVGWGEVRNKHHGARGDEACFGGEMASVIVNLQQAFGGTDCRAAVT
jgi:hypothetical protein